MVMFASSAVICGLRTTWRTTSRKRSSNHPGQVPGNQLRHSPANSESGHKCTQAFGWYGTLHQECTKERSMLRLVGLVCISLTTFPALGQSISKYQVATMTHVQTHHPARR